MQTGSEGGENFVSSTGGVTTTHGTYVEKVNRCNSGGRTGKREREKKRSIDHDKRGGREGGERVLQVQDTLISPTGGFYRLQPPSDTRLVVKISDAPWAGERGRAVNRCRLIEHIHVRPSYIYVHTIFFTVPFQFTNFFSVLRVSKTLIPLPLPVPAPRPFENRLRIERQGRSATRLQAGRTSIIRRARGRGVRGGIDARTCLSRRVYTHRKRCRMRD